MFQLVRFIDNTFKFKNHFYSFHKHQKENLITLYNKIHIQLQDYPSGHFNYHQYGNRIKHFEREDKFELMLVAIEENSGHMIVLKTIEWGKSISLQYDCTKEMHERLKLNHLNTCCKVKHSQFIRLLRKYITDILSSQKLLLMVVRSFFFIFQIFFFRLSY